MNAPLPDHTTAVPLDKAYRLLNHGPTVLVSASHGGVHNVMAAAWACPLDFSPPKVTVVLDKATRTRGLVEQQTYDLFAGEVVAAWADSRVFSGGRWHFEAAPDALRTLHHVAGGHFYAIGDAVVG